MKQNLLHTMLISSLCATIVACSDTDALVNNSLEDGKTPIILSVGGVDTPQEPNTRAVVTDNPYNPKNFTQKTTINFVMKSDKVGGTDAHYCVTRGVLDPSVNANIVDFGENTRYWDDTFARDAAVSLWAYTAQGTNWSSFAVGGKTAVSNWGTEQINPTIDTWKVSDNSNLGVQSESTIQNQDLIFSNNIVNYVGNENILSASRKDNRLKFNNTNAGKFDKADLKFYHAMSKITVNLVEGKGFESSPFAITTAKDIASPANGNVIISDINMVGKFDIAKGEFISISDNTTAISQMWNTTSTVQTIDSKKTWTLQALVIPNFNSESTKSAFKKDDTSIMIQFGIDNNVYNVSQAVLFAALNGKTGATTISGTPDYIPLEAGKNYVFTFFIGKKQIENITAQIAEWENVIAEDAEPTNARIKLLLEERGTDHLTSNVAFYKSNDNKTTDGIDDTYATYNWKSGYKNMNATYSSDHWTTNLFWDSNKDFYHFRALTPASTTINSDDATNGDYFTLSSSSCNDEDSYNSIAWGAPMLDDADDGEPGVPSTTLKWNYDYTKYGFDGKTSDVEANPAKHQIYKAIGPSEDPVKLILFHMMSGVHFTIKTDDAKDDKVKLYDSSVAAEKQRPIVQLVGYLPDGKVYIGNGLVVASGTAYSTESVGITCQTKTTGAYDDQEYFFSAVPQNLTAVKLYITTPDNNQYIVDLKDVKTKSVTNANITNPYGTDMKIDRWYPGFKYNYSFSLAKTGITNLSATIVDWETVTAEDETVQIK